jgi:Tfp pilus assembly protein PilX
MKSSPPNRCQGNILMMTLIMIVVISAFVGVAVSVTGTTARITDRSRDYAAARAAAEGAVEYAYAQWYGLTSNDNGPVSTTTMMAALTPPTFPGFTYAPAAIDGQLRVDAVDQYGAPTTTLTSVSVSLTNYPGWTGQVYTYLARAKMTALPAQYSFAAGVKRQFQYIVVPLFQSMFFFQDNIEIYKAATMTVNGLVHTNSSAYLSGQSGDPLTFESNVSYVNSFTSTADPPYANTWSGWSANAEIAPVYTTSQASQLHQVTAMQPLGTDLTSAINTTDTNPNNDSINEIIQPPNTAYPDPPAFATRRYYNKAGLLIKINGSSTTITGQNGLTLTAAQQTAISKALSSKTTIYDQRQGTNVNVTSINVATLESALNSTTGFNDVLYVYDTTSSSTPNAVRLTNGGVLPSAGLTVASMNPVYIQGDYNTGTTTNPNLVPANVGNASDTASPTVSGYTRAPASVIGDAVMLLSNSWSDSNSAQTLASRNASNTTYNTAIVSGFMPSGYQPTVGAQYGYSGGANNFPRFLEDWTGNYCTYYGSMVELFASQIFTGQWNTGNIYAPPIRCWNFDPNFTANPPPGSLSAVSWSRGTWIKY